MLMGLLRCHARCPAPLGWKALQVSLHQVPAQCMPSFHQATAALLFPSLSTPFTTLDSIGNELVRQELECDNLIRKRRRKMNKHKHSKMLKKQRFLRRKLGK